MTKNQISIRLLSLNVNWRYSQKFISIQIIYENK